MLFYILGIFAIILMITANIRSRQRPLPGKKPFLTWDRLGIMLSCAFLFLILVLQDTHSNGDLLQYYNRYTSLQYTSISSFLNGFWDMKDPVYHFLSLLFGKLGFDFYAWKSLIAFVFVLGIYKQIQYYSTNPSISFLAILTLGLYGFAFSGLRQTLAFGILLFSYPHLKNKHFFRFVLLVVLAAMFHSTALIFLVVYPIYQLKLRVRNVLLLIVAGTVASFFANPIAKLYLQLTGTDEAYSTYLEESSVLSISGIIISGSIWLFCTVFLYRSKSNKTDGHLCNLSLLALFGRILSTIWIAELFRISMYFSIFEFLMIADACSCKEKSTFVVRLKTAGVSLALAAYYFISPNANILDYMLR